MKSSVISAGIRTLSASQGFCVGAVCHYRQRSPLWVSFFAIAIVCALASLYFFAQAGRSATSLMSVEMRAGSKVDGRTSEDGVIVDQVLRTTSGEATDLFDQPWSEASLKKMSISGLDDNESVDIESFEVREIEAGKATPILYFDDRPIHPVKTMTMVVTAYSPDARSCAPFDDGITASGYSVWTNGMKLIAADKRFKFGDLLSVPGYNGSKPTPVLDRGAAIKGNRLDVLFPTHAIARQWGRQKLTVTIWEYVD